MVEAKFSQYARKTVVALIIGCATAVATALGILLSAMSDGSAGGSVVIGSEWVQFAIALILQLGGAVGTAYGVYQSENAPQPARPAPVHPID